MAVTSVARLDPILVMRYPKNIEPIKLPRQTEDLSKQICNSLFLQNVKKNFNENN